MQRGRTHSKGMAVALAGILLFCCAAWHLEAQELPDSLLVPAQPDSLPVPARPDTLAAAVPPLPVEEEPLQQEEEPLALEDQVIAYARSFMGTPYRLGATGPREFDCSSFTSYVFRHFGYTITAFSQAQFREGREVARYNELKKGDLVFFGKRAGVRNIGHVGIVVSIDEEQGSFTFIHASVSKGVTEETSNHPYFMMRYIGARRILPE